MPYMNNPWFRRASWRGRGAIARTKPRKAPIGVIGYGVREYMSEERTTMIDAIS